MENLKLINILLQETQSLKIQYLEMIVNWSNRTYSLMQERSKWDTIKWCEFFGIQPATRNAGTSMAFLSFPHGFYNTRNARIYDSILVIPEVFAISFLNLHDTEK